MPKSLRVKLGGLRYKGILEDKDYKRLCKALDNEDVLEKVREEINTMPCAITSMREIYVRRDKVINILDKYKTESEDGK